MFHASLAAMLTGPHSPRGLEAIYGIGMLSIVPLWDMLILAMGVMVVLVY